MLESKVLFFLLHSLCSITWMTHEEGLNAGSIISQQSLAYNTVILQPKSLIGIGLWNGLWAHLNHLPLIWSKTYGKLLFLSSPHFVTYDWFHFLTKSLLWGCVLRPVLMFCAQERPNHNNSTASRLLSEVKYCQALLVLQWGTMLESKVLFFPFVLSYKEEIENGHLIPSAGALLVLQ